MGGQRGVTTSLNTSKHYLQRAIPNGGLTLAHIGIWLRTIEGRHTVLCLGTYDEILRIRRDFLGPYRF